MEDDEPLTPEAMLAMASTFDVVPFNKRAQRGYVREVRVERTGRNPDAWAIRSEGADLARDGEWEFASMPSSRTDEFYARCRWLSAVEAITFAREHLRRYPSGYKPEADEAPLATDAPA